MSGDAIEPANTPALRTAALTLAALLGFAANSVLCRLALAGEAIDAASFTAVRLGSGAVALAILASVTGAFRRAGPSGAGWLSALALFVYASAFSLAYLKLQTGVGALVLFGFVQLTMVGWGFVRGERLSARQWLGFLLAVGGLLALTAPGISAPDPLAALLMGAAGVAWGVYSIRGKGVADPLAATAGNFIRTVPLAAGLVALAPVLGVGGYHLESRGLMIAITSGALASGLAYSLWYAALRSLQSTQAAVVQLCVPVLAGLGGILLLAEPITLRLLAAGAAILAGVALAVVSSART